MCATYNTLTWSSKECVRRGFGRLLLWHCCATVVEPPEPPNTGSSVSSLSQFYFAGDGDATLPATMFHRNAQCSTVCVHAEPEPSKAEPNEA